MLFLGSVFTRKLGLKKATVKTRKHGKVSPVAEGILIKHEHITQVHAVHGRKDRKVSSVVESNQFPVTFPRDRQRERDSKITT